MNHKFKLVAVSMLGLLASAASFATGSGDQAGTASVKTEVNVKDLNKHPDKFAGQQVMVTGKIDKIESPNAFILDGRGLLNDKILVVVEQPKGGGKEQAGVQAPVLKENEKIRLEGRVEQIGLTKIEERYQPGLRAEVRAEFEGTMPVLVVRPNQIKVQG